MNNNNHPVDRKHILHLFSYTTMESEQEASISELCKEGTGGIWGSKLFIPDGNAFLHDEDVFVAFRVIINLVHDIVDNGDAPATFI